MDARQIVFLVFDGMKMLDLSGPAEVFAEANTLGANYELSYISASGRPVVTSAGTQIAVERSADDVVSVDTLIVTGGDGLVAAPIPDDLVAAVTALAPQGRRVVSICTGAFVLATAGMLTGRRATTHWRHTQHLQRSFPDVAVQPDALFVQDGDVFTSAGVSAGIDLALALIEQDHSASLAREVARNLVVFMQRPGGQSQFSAALVGRLPNIPTIRALTDAITAQPAIDHSAHAMAARAGMSARHLRRLFGSELGVTPAQFVQKVRLDHAKAMLDRNYGIAETARRAGFGSAESMRRAFIADLGISPSEYRSRFLTAQMQ